MNIINLLYYITNTKAPHDEANDIIKEPHRALWKKHDFTDKDKNLSAPRSVDKLAVERTVLEVLT